MTRSRDTIYALSSGAPPAGVAVIRASGDLVPGLLCDLLGEVPEPRRAHLRSLRDGDGNLIDTGLILSFPAPQSFTGEHCCEFQLHGGRAVIDAVSILMESHGLRIAEAGEFSRRAFDNGKLDLVEIEGLADLLTAETEMQRRLAAQQSSGQLSGLYQTWMQELTRARALIEAELDFPDEEDVPGSVSAEVWTRVALLADAIAEHLRGSKAAEIVRDGFKVVIAGNPNVGKSSLMNALARRNIAIVTEIAGTTRDLIEVDLDLGGYLVRLVDTAGLRATEDLVEVEGIRRAKLSIAEADLVLHLRDGEVDSNEVGLETDAEVVTVVSKIDILKKAPANQPGVEFISAITGQGIDSLTKLILQSLNRKLGSITSLTPVRRRQQNLLQDVLQNLNYCIQIDAGNLEVRSEYLRQAAHSLGKLTGFVDVEDLLGVIFSEFCIGK